MSCPSGKESLTKRQGEDSIANRKSPVLSARGRRSDEMIRARAEAGKSTKNAVEEMLK